MSTIIEPTEQAMSRPDVDWSRYYTPDPQRVLRADPNRRVPMRFPSEGLRLAGHIYRPPGATQDERTPALVMLGPFSSVKEQTLPHYAERLADAGYTVLTFDSRSFGESEGEPRWHYDPNQIIQDYTNAVSYMLSRPDVDADRIGLVGVCMGGGYAISTAARDKRVRAVASVAGGYNIGATFQRFMGIEGFAGYLARVNALTTRQYETGEVQYIPTIAHTLSEEEPVVAMPNDEAFSYYDRTHRTDAPTWSERMTAAGLEPYFLYNAITHAPLVAPAPLLIVHGTTDFFLLPEYAQAAYDAAVGPKQIIWIETHNHIELYDQDPYVSQAVEALVPWLDANLKHRETRTPAAIGG
ncbi:MAG: alpha/beta hydrolase [Dehalococcoidia bacterium]